MSLFDALLLDPAPFQVWITDRSDRQRGSGTASDPYDGGAGKLDALMNQLASVPNLMVRLGPGVFTTQGYSDGASGGWQARPGMKIVGSGVEVTKLKLAGVTQNGVQYFVVGHPLSPSAVAVDAFEISDLALECGADLSPTSAYGGIRIMGSHARILTLSQARLPRNQQIGWLLASIRSVLALLRYRL